MKFDKLVKFLIESQERPISAVDEKGNKTWRLNGELHRLDGPARENADGYKAWLINGKFHRIDGPAVIFANKDKAWYRNGKWHREDGPAVDYIGHKAWYLDGKELTEEEFNEFLKQKQFKQEMSQQEDKMFDDDFLKEL